MAHLSAPRVTSTVKPGAERGDDQEAARRGHRFAHGMADRAPPGGRDRAIKPEIPRGQALTEGSDFERSPKLYGPSPGLSNRNASEESAALQPEQFLSEAGESDLAQGLRCLANTSIRRGCRHGVALAGADATRTTKDRDLPRVRPLGRGQASPPQGGMKSDQGLTGSIRVAVLLMLALGLLCGG